MITVYTLPFCPRCDELKSFLAESNVTYNTVDLDDTDASVDLIMKGIVPNEAPLLEVGEHYYDPTELFNSGKLNIDFIQSIGAGFIASN